jgi:hypothetical protein
MNVQQYLNSYIENINSINTQNENKYDFHLVEVIKPLKETHKTKEMKDYENYMRVYKNDFLTHESRTEKEDVFHESKINVDNTHINFFELDIETKKHHIINFLARKKYKLVNTNLECLNELLENNDILKKAIHLSKTHSNIEKIDFLKKVEDNEYTFNLNFQEKKKISKKNFFKK